MSIEGYKDGSLLYFKRDGKKIAFDLKDLSFYTVTRNNNLRKVQSGQQFFRNLQPRDVADGFKDPKYAQLIKLVNGTSWRRKANFATVFAALSKYAHLESYLLLDVPFNGISIFQKPVNQFPKEVLAFMKESQIVFGTSMWEANFQKYPEVVTNLCTHARRNYYLDLEVYRMIYDLVSYSSSFESFVLMSSPQTKDVLPQKDAWSGRVTGIKETGYGCEYKTLFDYLVTIERTEACAFSEAMRLYRDYLRMMREVERNKAIAKMRETNRELNPFTIGYINFHKVEKYPKYLKVRHDIVAKNYRNWQSEVDEIVFARMVERGFAWQSGDYQMVVPTKADDVRNEGTAQHHCVASYVNKIMDGTTQIVFMRKNPEDSLVTVEIRANAIIQARGYCNRSVTEEEETWLKAFAKAKNVGYKDVAYNSKLPSPPVVALAKYDADAAILRELSMLAHGQL